MSISDSARPRNGSWSPDGEPIRDRRIRTIFQTLVNSIKKPRLVSNVTEEQS